MPAVTNGAELTKLLRESKTGENKLAVCRKVLERVRDEEKRIATSDEVIAELVKVFGPDHLSCVKARAFAMTGEWHGLYAQEVVPVEDVLAPKKEPAKAIDPKKEPAKA